MAGDTCDTCKKKPTIGVAASGLGPISFAVCRECAQKGAEPSCMIDITVELCSGPDKVREEFWEIMTWWDGRYMTAREYWDTTAVEREAREAELKAHKEEADDG